MLMMLLQSPPAGVRGPRKGPLLTYIARTYRCLTRAAERPFPPGLPFPILRLLSARAAMAINGHRNKSFGPGGGTRRLHPSPLLTGGLRRGRNRFDGGPKG